MDKVLDIVIAHKVKIAEWKLSGSCPQCGSSMSPAALSQNNKVCDTCIWKRLGRRQ